MLHQRLHSKVLALTDDLHQAKLSVGHTRLVRDGVYVVLSIRHRLAPVLPISVKSAFPAEKTATGRVVDERPMARLRSTTNSARRLVAPNDWCVPMRAFNLFPELGRTLRPEVQLFKAH